MSDPTQHTAGIYGVEGINVFCRDIAQMEEVAHFYTEILGLKWFLPYEPGQDYAAISTGTITLWLRPSLPGHLPVALGQTGQVALAVESLEASIEALGDRVTWDSATGRWDFPNGVYYRYRRIIDPAGNLMFLIECHDEKSPAGPGGPGYRPHEVGLPPRPEA